MKEVAIAIFLAIAISSLCWSIDGCIESQNKAETEQIKSGNTVQIEIEKTKQSQFQWKSDSVNSPCLDHN